MLASSRTKDAVNALLSMTLLTGVGFAVTGCPENSCFLKICSGADCKCSISSCSDGAAFDTKQNRCRCVVGYFDVNGSCLDQAHANAYCARGYAWSQNGCVQLQCRPGDELDLSTGYCIDKNAVAQQAGVQVGQGQKVGCAPGERLVVDGGAAACVPVAQSCARDEVWNGQACQKTGACPTGSSWDPSRNQCVTYASGGGGEFSVNVPAWAYANFGPDGGPGQPGFCSTFSKKPLSFGLAAGTSAVVRVQVLMSFPDNEIAKGRVQTVATFDYSGGVVPQKGSYEVQVGAESTFGPLQTGGGRASAPSAQTTVKCTIVNAQKPRPVPETGGV